MNASDFKKKFSEFTSEYLIELRAHGNGLSDDAHKAIEEIFLERGQSLPIRPAAPVSLPNTIDADVAPKNRALKAVYFLLLIVGILVAKFLAKWTAHSSIGILSGMLLGGFLVLYLAVYFIRRVFLSQEGKAREDEELEAKVEGLSELMVCSANGKIGRMKELLAYGHDVNQISFSGASALVYAARNNHLAAVEILLEAGADLRLKTNANSTALDVAKRFGHFEIADLLSRRMD